MLRVPCDHTVLEIWTRVEVAATADRADERPTRHLTSPRLTGGAFALAWGWVYLALGVLALGPQLEVTQDLTPGITPGNALGTVHSTGDGARPGHPAHHTVLPSQSISKMEVQSRQ